VLELLWLIPAIPFASALVLSVFGPRFSRRGVAVMGAGSIAAAAVIAMLVAVGFLRSGSSTYTQVLWKWIRVDGFEPEIGLHLDALSLVMVLVVTFVGFFIHLYSTEFMAEDEDYSRFFAYMNLFVGSMITLLLADNLLLLYLGWEGVGLCSYLLIGFWYRDPENGLAARKAFIVTRVGDTAMSIALLLLFTRLGTLNIQELMQRASQNWPVGSSVATLAAFLLLGGAVGKSAQLPLQVWLPDAMAGPTPTSALIHAATMVTAGVYLIARTHVLFQLAPAAQLAVAVVGAATLLLAGCSALVQYDLKRALAYSTISQIGYMFLALGVGAWTAAIFHFLTHAFFKALLFLCAGVVIEALGGEHDIFRMGGLRHRLPLTFWAFFLAGCSMSGLPLITAGYFSKDLIIWGALAAEHGHAALWWAGAAGAVLTALYTFRLIFVVFFGDIRTPVIRTPGLAMTIPLAVLGIGAVLAGYLKNPLISYLTSALPPTDTRQRGFMTEDMSRAALAFAFAIGVYFAYLLYRRSPELAERVVATTGGRKVRAWWFSDWGFDWLYDRAFVRPFVWIANINRGDFIDGFYSGIARAADSLYRDLSLTETGRVRWYAAAILAGTVVFAALALWL